METLLSIKRGAGVMLEKWLLIGQQNKLLQMKMSVNSTGKELTINSLRLIVKNISIFAIIVRFNADSASQTRLKASPA